MADYATLVFDIDSTQARGAAKALGDLNSAAIKAANGSARFEKTLRDVNGRFQSTDKYLTSHRAEIEGLAMAYNPVLAAQIRYRDEVVKTAAAVKAGVITEQQRVDILQRTKTALDATASAAGRFGQQQQVATHHVSNLSFQLNDIGMMMASGQNPFMLMIQQGPQVAQIFSQMNAEGRKIGPTLAAAFQMFLNPTTLVTLALIGGTAALYQWATAAGSAGASSKTVGEAVDKLSTSVNAYVEASRAAKASNDSLRESYGSLSREAAAALDNIAGIERQKALDAIAASTKKIFDGTTVSLQNASPYLQGYTDQVERLDYAFKLNGKSADEVLRAINRLSASKGPSQVAASAQALSESLEAAYGSFDKMPPKAREVYEAAQNITVEAGKIVSQTDSWASSMASVLSYTNAVGRSLANIGGGAIGRAAVAAEISALKQGKSLAEASVAASRERARLESVEVVKGLKIQNKYLRAGAEFAANAIAQSDITRESQLDGLREIAREREKLAAKESSGSGKKGGGGSAERQAAAELKSAEKGFQSLRELLEKESIYQVAEYQRRQTQLDAALQKKLISEQNYQLMKTQLQQSYFGTEYERNQLQYDMDLQQLKDHLKNREITQLQHDIAMSNLNSQQITRLGTEQQTAWGQDIANMSNHFGEMASLAGNYNDKFLKAQKVFGAAAALISTYQGAAKALELPFPYNIAAAAKVLAAGMGFVSAIKGAGSGGGGGGGSSSAGSVKQEPTKNVLIRLEGDDWLTGLAEQMMTQIYEASSNGRVIVSRDNS